MMRSKSKYGARKTIVDGITFSSAGEAGRYKSLTLLQKNGDIENLVLQPVFELAPSVVIGGRKRPPLRYVADFSYIEKGQQVIEDFKGFRTHEYRIKRHLMKAIHGIEIRETGV